ncbi:serine carboxypeptidase s28 protein [Cystoisospora suis]|uniref:Serine carboxypeptidase s28 protein n=1 Tax=Cystoisospora suis TaxID=483139 RepID=A0A2C6KPQ9_9APIC|nr:serine carboxypeptidase s28 protein [Cystoisospora suis]
MALSSAEGEEVYGEISPIPSSELEMLKLILTPYEGEILYHDALGEKAVVQFPNKQALEAIQEIPTYHTVEIPKPSVKEEDEKVLRHSRGQHEEEEEKVHKEGEEEEESRNRGGPGMPLKGEEAYVQKDEPHERHSPAEESASTIAAASGDSRPVSTSPVSATAGAPSPPAAPHAEEAEKKTSHHTEEERKRTERQEEKEEKQATLTEESQTLTKRKALPSDDLFYLFADAKKLAFFPFDDLLSFSKALNDLAAFISYIKQKTAAEDGGEDIRPEDVPVVVFGCSYPGSLAAYARAKYPALILGAISSSSPVEASALFTEYDQTVRRVLPLECVENITAATAVVQKRLFSSDEAAARVAAQFGCDADVPTKTLDQRIALLYVIADMTSSAVQYNRPPTRPLIEKACSCFSGREEGEGVSGHINDDQDDDALVESLAKLVKIMFQEMRTTCKDENMLALTDTALGPQPASSARLWLWQSCAEFGFWQVAPPESVRSHLIDLDWHMRMCNALFPLPGGSKFSTDVVRETNVWSGEKTLAGPGASTNIHFTNGANDPWASLSVTNVPSNAVRRQKLSSFVIENGSHCNDFYAYAKGTEPRPVTEAKTRVLHSIRQWLEEFRVSRQRAKTTQEDLTAQEL